MITNNKNGYIVENDKQKTINYLNMQISVTQQFLNELKNKPLKNDNDKMIINSIKGMPKIDSKDIINKFMDDDVKELMIKFHDIVLQFNEL